MFRGVSTGTFPFLVDASSTIASDGLSARYHHSLRLHHVTLNLEPREMGMSQLKRLETFVSWKILAEDPQISTWNIHLAHHNGEHCTSRLGLSLPSIFLNFSICVLFTFLLLTKLLDFQLYRGVPFKEYSFQPALEFFPRIENRL